MHFSILLRTFGDTALLYIFLYIFDFARSLLKFQPDFFGRHLLNYPSTFHTKIGSYPLYFFTKVIINTLKATTDSCSDRPQFFYWKRPISIHPWPEQTVEIQPARSFQKLILFDGAYSNQNVLPCPWQEKT